MENMTDKIKIAPCLWFNKNAEEAAKFYAALRFIRCRPR